MLAKLIGFGVLVTPEKGLLPSGVFTGVAALVIGPRTGVPKRVRRALDAALRQFAEQ